MKRTNLILGMMLLLVAAAVAVYTTDGAEDLVLVKRGSQARGLPARPGLDPSNERGRLQAKSRRPKGGYHPVIESLKVEPHNPTHPAYAAQADRVERGVHNRLRELSEGLDLSEQQQLAIFPILARSHADYDGQLRLVGIAAGVSPLPLSRRAADRLLRGQLDPTQQIELEIMDLEAEAWWTDVIARLERDLEESTRAPLATGSAPPPGNDPSPREDNQQTPAAPAPRPGSHPGTNLKDLLGGSAPR